VLVEDVKQELAPIAVLQYPITKGTSGKDTGTWPILHCHPKARGPFIEFDEREERRWRKAENAEKEREREREQRRKRFEQRRRSLKENQFKAQHDLRRTVSMNNLHRRGILPEVIPDGDPDHLESANASGYLPSGGYVAASGNSVGITSTTGTTSATTDSNLTKLQLPPSLRGRFQQEVVTSRRFGSLGKSKEMRAVNLDTVRAAAFVSKISKRWASSTLSFEGWINGFFSMYTDANTANLLLMIATMLNWMPCLIGYAVGRWRKPKLSVMVML
jgi:regulatory subunit for Cdc7p protein kinase